MFFSTNCGLINFYLLFVTGELNYNPEWNSKVSIIIIDNRVI